MSNVYGFINDEAGAESDGGSDYGENQDSQASLGEEFLHLDASGEGESSDDGESRSRSPKRARGEKGGARGSQTTAFKCFLGTCPQNPFAQEFFISMVSSYTRAHPTLVDILVKAEDHKDKMGIHFHFRLVFEDRVRYSFDEIRTHLPIDEDSPYVDDALSIESGGAALTKARYILKCHPTYGRGYQKTHPLHVATPDEYPIYHWARDAVWEERYTEELYKLSAQSKSDKVFRALLKGEKTVDQIVEEEPGFVGMNLQRMEYFEERFHKEPMVLYPPTTRIFNTGMEMRAPNQAHRKRIWHVVANPNVGKSRYIDLVWCKTKFFYLLRRVETKSDVMHAFERWKGQCYIILDDCTGVDPEWILSVLDSEEFPGKIRHPIRIGKKPPGINIIVVLNPDNDEKLKWMTNPHYASRATLIKLQYKIPCPLCNKWHLDECGPHPRGAGVSFNVPINITE